MKRKVGRPKKVSNTAETFWQDNDVFSTNVKPFLTKDDKWELCPAMNSGSFIKPISVEIVGMKPPPENRMALRGETYYLTYFTVDDQFPDDVNPELIERNFDAETTMLKASMHEIDATFGEQQANVTEEEDPEMNEEDQLMSMLPAVTDDSDADDDSQIDIRLSRVEKEPWHDSITEFEKIGLNQLTEDEKTALEQQAPEIFNMNYPKLTTVLPLRVSEPSEFCMKHSNNSILLQKS